jgi:hypothetical protein
MIEIPTDLPAEIVPLSWLLGVWEGTGVVDYQEGEDDSSRRTHEFGQRVSFSHDGLPFLNYSSYTWLLDERHTPLASETGYWRLDRPAEEGDRGPGMLPGIGVQPFTTPRAVEILRTPDDGFNIEVSLVHPSGVNELYLGRVKGPRIDLSTDSVLRSSNAKEYSAATRMYGLVENHLLWAWDIAALGNELRTHASGRLAHVD